MSNTDLGARFIGFYFHKHIRLRFYFPSQTSKSQLLSHRNRALLNPQSTIHRNLNLNRWVIICSRISLNLSTGLSSLWVCSISIGISWFAFKLWIGISWSAAIWVLHYFSESLGLLCGFSGFSELLSELLCAWGLLPN